MIAYAIKLAKTLSSECRGGLAGRTGRTALNWPLIERVDLSVPNVSALRGNLSYHLQSAHPRWALEPTVH